MPGASDRIAGVGVGLRAPHYAAAGDARSVPWLEIVTDNYLGSGGSPRFHLERLRTTFPMVMHGVGLSIGSTDHLDFDYLRRVRALSDAIEPAWISDHLCWTGVAGRQFHELLPLPLTEEAVRHVVARIGTAQEILGRRLVLENVTSYHRFESEEMTEPEFLGEVANRADCELLVDVNNIHVNSVNHGFDARAFVDTLPGQRVRQLHLAGHDDRGTHLLDAHGGPVQPPVWELYRHALRRWGSIPTCVEWDANLPSFAVLVAEAERASRLMEEVGALAA